MPLTPGTWIGSYEIVGAIGAGGMGEVYRARDSTLGRDVAIKVLPDLLGDDAERLTRFEREARTLAALNHPNIAAIYGVEPMHSGRAIVMEFVPGDDLLQRLRQSGPIPLTEALGIAKQIANALEAAHAQGIIHRDLKPANIKVRDDGEVKVLDFGLAKAVGPDGANAAGDSRTAATVTSPSTQIGTVLGTAAYMAPEQARGRPLDKRADVWAYGCVLYEVLTGRRAFPGDDITETIAAVVRGEPDWSALPRELPPAVGVFLRRCLAKSPKDRVQDIGDMRLALEGAFDPLTAPVDGRLVASSPSKSPRWIAPALIAIPLALASGIGTWLLKPTPAAAVQPMRAFVITPTPGPLAIANTNRDVAMTSDGTRLVYLAGEGSERTLYVRALDALAPTVLRRGDRFFDPFTSPDSKWVAFIDESDFTLLKIPLSGGPPVRIASTGREIAGATWGSDGTIVFAYSGFDSGLMVLPEGGESASVLTTPDKARGEAGHYWPEFLPGGHALLYTVRAGERGAHSQVWAIDMRTRLAKKLVETGTGGRYSATGHLIYGADDALWAVRFDPEKLEVRGDAVQLISGIPAKNSGAVNFALSADGSLVYVNAVTAAPNRRLVWIDRATGTRQPVEGQPPRAYTTARVSPDGTRVALDIRDEGGDIWIWDLKRNVSTKITNDPASDAIPSWTPDSARIVFQSQRFGVPNIFVQSADGTGSVERLTESANAQYPSAVARDGTIMYWEVGPRVPWDILMLALAGPRRAPVPLLQSAAVERNAEPSPDGKWLAYGSNENQALLQEVYVRPFPDVGAGRVQISSGGGMYPMWMPGTSSHLFYVGRDGRLVSVPMRDGAPSGPRVVLEGGFYTAPNPRTFDIAPDGTRFLVIENLGASKEASASGLVVVLNWANELRRKLPRD